MLATSVLIIFLMTQQVLSQLQQPICYNTDEVIKAHEIMRAAANCSHVWMSRSEQALIQAYLDDDKHMLEIGSGFSTMWYSQFVNSYTSIEHDAEWHKDVTEMIDTVPGRRNVSYHVVPLEWTLKQGEGDPKFFAEYLNKIDEVSQGRVWDVVLDDGRVRVGVAKRVLKYLKPESRVIIHDFWGREYYHEVLDLYSVVASVYDGQSIVILKPKGEELMPQR